MAKSSIRRGAPAGDAIAARCIAAMLALAACGGEEPSFAPAPRAPRSDRGPTPAPALARALAPTPAPALAPTPATSGRWYTLTLPPGAAPALVAGTDQIDAVYVLDRAENVSLTILRPMPGQTDLAAWTVAIDAIFDPPGSASDDALDGIPARLGVGPAELRWTLVADGVGVMIKCFSEVPRDEAWLRARCDPTVRSIRFVRPIAER